MNSLGNVIWLLFGGLLIGVQYIVSSLGMMITIIGIPFGIQTLKIGMMALWPFGKTTRVVESSSGCVSTIMNIIWIVIGGFWICLSHIGWGILLSITIIGIPFARQHFKLAALALTPFGREIIDK